MEIDVVGDYAPGWSLTRRTKDRWQPLESQRGHPVEKR